MNGIVSSFFVDFITFKNFLAHYYQCNEKDLSFLWGLYEEENRKFFGNSNIYEYAMQLECIILKNEVNNYYTEKIIYNSIFDDKKFIIAIENFFEIELDSKLGIFIFGKTNQWNQLSRTRIINIDGVDSHYRVGDIKENLFLSLPISFE